LEQLATRIRYRRGQEIYKEDSPVEYWYRIVSGMARRFSARADGKRQIVDLLLPGDVFGFGGSGKHHFAVEAVLLPFFSRNWSLSRSSEGHPASQGQATAASRRDGDFAASPFFQPVSERRCRRLTRLNVAHGGPARPPAPHYCPSASLLP